MGIQVESGVKHFHCWIAPDNGTSEPNAFFKRSPKFANRESAMRAAIHYGADRESAMARACHC